MTDFSAWGYYTTFNVSGSSDGELTDYQISVTLDYEEGVMKSDFGDIRFALQDTTELSYHLVSYTSGVSANFVIKVPTIPVSPGSVLITIYAGNASATTTSDPESVYDFYDDFNDGSLDLSKWTWIRESIGNWDEGVTEAGKLNIKTQNTEIYGTANNAAILRTNQQFTDNFIAECTLKLTPTANFQRGMLIIYTNDNKHIGIGRIYNSYQGGRKLIVQNEIDGTTSEYYTNGDVNELKVKISKLGTDYLCYYDIGANWVLFQTRTNNSITNPYVSLVSQSYSGGGGGLNVFYDDVKVYKTTANPPEISSIPDWNSNIPQTITSLDVLTSTATLNDVIPNVPAAVAAYITLSKLSAQRAVLNDVDIVAEKIQWGQLTHTLEETLHSSCTVLYDIFRENIDQQQTVNDITINLGTTNYKYWMETFKPKKTNLTGLGIKAMGQVGSPGALIVGIYSVTGTTFTLIQEHSLQEWSSDEEILLPFDISTLDLTKTYCFILSAVAADNSNYYKLRATSTNQYIDGESKYKKSTGNWITYTGDLWFKTYYPVNILTNQEAPINLSNIPYTEIKVRGKLATTNLSYTPKIDNIKITKERVIDD
jgi:hypothetical protein